MPTPAHITALREKIGHDLLHLPGVTAIVVNAAGHVLLGQRSDTGRWHTIGGMPDPGESPAACCIREVKEETGLDVRIERITGVYAPPPMQYPNGDRCCYILTCFLCHPIDDAQVPYVADDESLAVAYFPPEALPPMNDAAVQRVRDALSDNAKAAFYL